MKLFHLKKEETPKLTPDMAGYRPSKDWWPDLTDYRKGILLHNISLENVKKLLVEYASISKDKKEVVCEFYYAFLPGSTEWVYLELPNFKDVPHYCNFWTYQNIMIWLSDKSDREFCLAIPKNQRLPLFFSMMDKENPYGDSTIGIYASRSFGFSVPEEILEWGEVPGPGQAFDYQGYLKEKFDFDTRQLADIVQCKWEKVELTLSFGEE